MPQSNYLSIDQVAEELSIHRDTVRRAISQRKLKAGRAGNQYRIRRSDLDAWLGVV